jgi:hypothetical protein
MDLKTRRPLGDSTTVLDIADRDDMDDDMFPLSSEKTWFTRAFEERRILNFAPVIQEFEYKGTAEFGQRLVFEIGSVKACDLLFTVALQLRLGHWFDSTTVQYIQNQYYTYQDPQDAWFYANSLGTAIIAKAEFMMDDQVLETVAGDFATVFGLLWSDINTQIGVGTDGVGRVPQNVLENWPPQNVFPTSNGFITCVLPFSFQRIRLRNAFPLTSVREGTIRVAITLRPFSECVRIRNGSRATCNETPLGKSFTFDVASSPPSTATVVASSVVPPFADARLVTYGVLVDGKLREALLKAPFERMYREVQTFRFDEPKKYAVASPETGVVRLQLPIEINGPVEELIWFIRRKAVRLNNEWTNYSNRVELDYYGLSAADQQIYYPPQGMLVRANLQVNGISLIEAEGPFFQREIATRHRGGVVAYNSFVYGYTFAQNPGLQNPSGWFNASRSQDVRLRVDVRPPSGSVNVDAEDEYEFEVVVYALAMNWVRFQNGICNKIFSS